ncbi:MAG: HD-GYP domain-containing protein [Thermodesulfobacteriota bacterium]|jgi:HD-GYP domain-containing protein (c-di-GMP phosphodiesterase class II)
MGTEDLFLIENVTGQIATAIENFELNKDIEETYYQTLLTLARVVEAKDPYSAGHLERVSKYCEKMAVVLDLDEETKKVLSRGAVLHDLGKVGIQETILKKEDRFNDEEFGIMRQHAIIGENILKPLQSMAKLNQLVRHHHEAYDGSGSPDGLKGEDIPLTARILAVADIYDALTTDRPYRKALPREEAIEILNSYKGNKLDPKLTDIFIQTI